MFPDPESLPLYGDHGVNEAYIAAEIDAEKLSSLLATPFVIGDERHEVAQMNDVAEYRNGPLEPEACYSFFLRGFLSVPQVSCAVDSSSNDHSHDLPISKTCTCA